MEPVLEVGTMVEPVIAMLKPDAIERGLAAPILSQLQADGFVVQRRREMRLTPEQVLTSFLHPTPDYVAHLISRPVVMLLLRGPGGPERFYDCKRAIRAKFGIQGKIRNLLHGTDEGTEYHLFLARFFPQLPVLRHCGVADLDLRFPRDTSVAEAQAVLARLDRESDLIWVSVSLRREQTALLALQELVWKRLRVGFAVLHEAPTAAPQCAFLAHARASADLAALMPAGSTDAHEPPWETWKATARAITVTDLIISEAQLERYQYALRAPAGDVEGAVWNGSLLPRLLRLKACGVSRLNVFAPRRRLIETELLGDLARAAGLQLSGGSAGCSVPGHFSVSQYGIGGLDLPLTLCSHGSDPARVPEAEGRSPARMRKT